MGSKLHIPRASEKAWETRYDWKTPPNHWPWNQVTVDANGCWLVRNTRIGYARIQVNGHRRVAHRLAFEIAFGPIPDGKLVCHTCDTKPCIRPTHLFAGTSSDNAYDAYIKGRSHPPTGSRGAKTPHRAKGESNGNSRLLTTDIQSIREAHTYGATVIHIAHSFHIDRAAVRYILFKGWRHVR